MRGIEVAARLCPCGLGRVAPLVNCRGRDVQALREFFHRDEAWMPQCGSIEAVVRYNLVPKLTLSAGPSVNFANRRYMQTFFGIDALQSQ
jgi:MltA-interacting protein MipA